MPFEICDDRDYIGVRCCDCGKVVVSKFSPLKNNLHITEEDYYNIQEHTKKCPQKGSLSTILLQLEEIQAKANKVPVPELLHVLPPKVEAERLIELAKHLLFLHMNYESNKMASEYRKKD